MKSGYNHSNHCDSYFASGKVYKKWFIPLARYAGYQKFQRIAFPAEFVFHKWLMLFQLRIVRQRESFGSSDPNVVLFMQSLRTRLLQFQKCQILSDFHLAHFQKGIVHRIQYFCASGKTGYHCATVRKRRQGRNHWNIQIAGNIQQPEFTLGVAAQFLRKIAEAGFPLDRFINKPRNHATIPPKCRGIALNGFLQSRPYGMIF